MKCEEIFETFYVELPDGRVLVLGPGPRNLS